MRPTFCKDRLPSKRHHKKRGRGREHGVASSVFDTWSYESNRPFSIEALREMVRRELPASVYRCKEIVYVADAPERRAVLQVVGRRMDVALVDEWGGRKPRTQLVAIGAPGSIDAEERRKRFDACVSDSVKGCAV